MADLPERWAYGVRVDGRVFFISDRTRTTTWLHPRTGLPVNSGHMIRSDLPLGWEEGFTHDGACYFIDHNERRTTFLHPQTGVTSRENCTFNLQELSTAILPQTRLMAALSDSSTNASNNNKMPSSGSKRHSFGKTQLSVKRNLSASVERRGWLYKQDGSGMRLWKRKWFVLSEFCLFYYKDSREQTVLGSIPLPGSEVCPVSAQDHISRKYAFKAYPSVTHAHLDKRSTLIGPFKRSRCLIGPFKRSSFLIGSQVEHSGMRTYFFSAETQEDMNAWIRAMNRASRVQTGVQNGVRKVQNGVHCGTNTTTDRSSDLLESTQSSEKNLVHEVQLEPVLDPDQDSLLKTGPVSTATTLLATPPEKSGPTPSQNRFPVSTPSPILEPNGIAAGTYQTTSPSDTSPGSLYRQATPTGRQATPTGRQPSPTGRQPSPTGRQASPTGSTFRQATPPNSSLTRNSLREQVQHWVKVQRDETLGATPRESVHRQTPPSQFSPIEPPHSAPGGRVGEYRYAQDRLSHFGLSDSSAPASFRRLYEWQQRHQYRHGNPTAPLYSPAPLHPYGPRPLVAAEQSRAPTPRCIEVLPTATEVPPLPPSGPIGRRPHTPAERLTVRPTNERAAEGGAFTAAPRRSQSQFFKTSTLERRSLPLSGHMTHTVSAPSLHGKTVDESFLKLNKDLEYLDLKTERGRARKPLRAAESDIDVKLSRLCEKDKTLKDLETRLRALRQDKEELEAVLALSHQQMEHFSDQTCLQKISIHQRVLQEDLVQVRAQLSRTYTDFSRSLEEFVFLEKSVEQLRSALKNQMDLSSIPQSERAELKRELWRVEDVLAGLSRRPPSDMDQSLEPDLQQLSDRKLVPSVEESVPSNTKLLQTELNWSPGPSPPQPPPRPPLPCGFYDDDDSRPEVPPLPREAAVIRHTSVRGLKRQSDERRRDRDGADWKFQSDLRSFLSEPDLPLDSEPCGASGLSRSSSELNQSSVSAFVTLRRGTTPRDHPKSALESSASSSALDSDWSAVVQSHGRMSVDEQEQRLQQRALVRERQRSGGTTPRPQVCARAPPPTPKRSSSRNRHRQLRQELNRQQTETQIN